MGKATTGSAKRYGTRYGRALREKIGIIEKEQRKLYQCPYCNHKKVKRTALGIWQCRKCNAKFAGRAYEIAKTKTTELA
jgi:large subunit ribosomal protein L37Ae